MSRFRRLVQWLRGALIRLTARLRRAPAELPAGTEPGKLDIFPPGPDTVPDRPNGTSDHAPIFTALKRNKRGS